MLKTFYCPRLEVNASSSLFFVLPLQLKSVCPGNHTGYCFLYVYSKSHWLIWLDSRGGVKLEPKLHLITLVPLTQQKPFAPREGGEKSPLLPGAKILNHNKWSTLISKIFHNNFLCLFPPPRRSLYLLLWFVSLLFSFMYLCTKTVVYRKRP